MTNENELPGCGTPQAYRRHVAERAKQRASGAPETPIDQPCRDAWAKWMRQRSTQPVASVRELSGEEEEVIRMLRSTGERIGDIAREFDVPASYVSLVCRRVSS